MSIPVLFSVFIPPCDESFLLSGCDWAAAAIVWNLQIVFYLVATFLFLLIYKKPKLYRAVLTIICANMTLFVLYLFYGEILFSEESVIGGLAMVFIFLFPGLHLFYFFLFNTLSSFTKSKK